MNDIKQSQINIARWLLRIGLAFVYGYVSVEMFVDPSSFLKYVPQFMQQIMPLNIFMVSFGIFEILLTLWLLSGKGTEYAGIISAFLMIAIIVPNTAYFSILFRNVAIGFASLALTTLDYRRQRLP